MGDTQPRLLREGDAAELLTVSPRTLADWRYTGGGPRYIRLSGRAIRYRLAELERFIAERERINTSDEGSE